MERDGGSGAVAAREEPLAIHRAARRDAAQLPRNLAERHRLHLAFDLALAACFSLRRPVVERAFEGGDAGRRVAQVAAGREDRREREPVAGVDVAQDGLALALFVGSLRGFQNRDRVVASRQAAGAGVAAG